MKKPSQPNRAFLVSLILLMLTLTACGETVSPSSPAATPTFVAPPSDCKNSSEPTELDVKQALAFQSSTFPAPAWERSYAVKPFRVNVTWSNASNGAVAYQEYLLYPCGKADVGLKEFFTPDTLNNVLLKDYQNPKLVSSCSNAEQQLTLYDMTADHSDQSYQVRFWAKPLSETRGVYVMLVFPKSNTEFNQYAQTAFPQFASC